jgi:hypothetical protein
MITESEQIIRCIIVNLTSQDFEPCERNESGDKYYACEIYPFMRKAGKAIETLQWSCSTVNFRFETISGEPWGGLDSNQWWNICFKELVNRKGYVVGRLWEKQKFVVVKETVKDHSEILLCKYYENVMKIHGVPARLVIKMKNEVT